MIQKSEVLDTLFEARDALSAIIIAASPTNAIDAAQIATLIQKRDATTGAINQVIEAAFNSSAGALTAPLADLQAKTAQLSALNKTLASVGTAIGVVDQLVQVVATILAVAAAA